MPDAPAETAGLPAGVRPLAALADEANGEEAVELARLLDAGVPLAKGVVVRLSGEDPEARLVRAIDSVASADALRLRPLFPTRSGAARFARATGPVDDVSADEPVTRVRELLEALRSREVATAFGGELSGLEVRIIPRDDGPRGLAASADPERGDPDELSVWTTGGSPWRIDRRSARVVQPGEGLDVHFAERAADLADRVQLVLGVPVEVEWITQDERVVVATVRPLDFRPRFAAGSWSRLALVAADEGTVAPLAIDTLDRALGAEEEGPTVAAAVRRIYARPYRRWEEERDPLGRSRPGPLANASARAARVATEVAPVLASAMRFERTYVDRLDALGEEELETLDTEPLLVALSDRQRLAAEALLLLDLCRGATRQGLVALEAVVGALPRDCYPALAAPRAVRSRRRVHDKLLRLAARVEADRGELAGPEGLPEATRRRWRELRSELARVRPLGIDVTPVPIGASDETLLDGLHRATHSGHSTRERARKDASRRVLATARSRSVGAARAALAASLTLLMNRVARAKGGVSEGVADTQLSLRDAATEVGRRLVAQAILDAPDDALYLTRAELEEALRGEPGAYASRVRLRREDDMRWAAFDAPRRLGRGS